MSSLKARNISGDGVIAGRPARGRHCTVTLIWRMLGTNVSGGIDERRNQDLALKVDQWDDFVICGPQDAVWSRQDLTVKNSRLALSSNDAVRSGQKERLESIEKNPPIAYVLDSREPDRCIVSCAVHSFQTFARLCFAIRSWRVYCREVS